jgi:hypothetical protein
VLACQNPTRIRDLSDMRFDIELRQAVAALPSEVRSSMHRALRSGWFSITAGTYGGGSEACPIVAAARMAGVWNGTGIRPGNPEWGGIAFPSPQVEDFAAYFDLYAEEFGIDEAVSIVLASLQQAWLTRRAA